MSNVYIVTVGSYSDKTICFIGSTREIAQKFIDTVENCDEENDLDYSCPWNYINA